MLVSFSPIIVQQIHVLFAADSLNCVSAYFMMQADCLFNYVIAKKAGMLMAINPFCFSFGCTVHGLVISRIFIQYPIEWNYLE